MKAAGLIGVLLALLAGYVAYNAQLTRSGTAAAGSPQETIDLTSIRTALMEIAQAERLYVSAHGIYGTLAELRGEGAPGLGDDRRGYAFQVQPNGSRGFTVTAAPSDTGRSGWPTLTIDETMQIASR
jgi:hypothetical protein